MVRMTPDRRQEVRFGMAFIALPLVAGLALEGASRLIRAQMDAQRTDWTAFANVFAPADAERLYLLRPNAQYAGVTTDSNGFRSPELQDPAADNHLRIAFVGDSVTLGASVPQDQIFAAQVFEAVQDARSGCSVDYFVFAGPGYSSEFLVEHWPPLADAFAPDVTVMLAGSPRELAPNREDTAYRLSWFQQNLAIVDLARRAVQRFGFHQMIPDNTSLSAEERQRIEDEQSDLVMRLDHLAGDRTTLFLDHRFRLRSADDENWSLDAHDSFEEGETGERTTAEVRQTRLVLEAAAQAAEMRDTRYLLMVQNQIAPDDESYADARHLTALGHQRLADAIIAQALPLIPECEA